MAETEKNAATNATSLSLRYPKGDETEKSRERCEREEVLEKTELLKVCREADGTMF